MTVNGSIATGIASNFSSNASFSDLAFVVAYENEIKPTPMTKPIVAISVKGCEIGEKLTETLDTGEITETDSREIQTTLSVDIYLPYSMGGSEGHKIFDRIATYFLFTKKFTISKATCDNIEYNKSCESLILRTCFVFKNTITS